MIENCLENKHFDVPTHLNGLHPARLFDLVVDDRSVLADWFIPCSETDGVLWRTERNRKSVSLKVFGNVCK